MIFKCRTKEFVRGALHTLPSPLHSRDTFQSIPDFPFFLADSLKTRCRNTLWNLAASRPAICGNHYWGSLQHGTLKTGCRYIPNLTWSTPETSSVIFQLPCFALNFVPETSTFTTTCKKRVANIPDPRNHMARTTRNPLGIPRNTLRGPQETRCRSPGNTLWGLQGTCCSSPPPRKPVRVITGQRNHENSLEEEKLTSGGPWKAMRVPPAWGNMYDTCTFFRFLSENLDHILHWRNMQKIRMHFRELLFLENWSR